MSSRHLSRFLFLVIAMCSLGVYAAQPNDDSKKVREIRIDLATTSTTQPVIRPGGGGKYRFTLVNAIPSKVPYAVNVEREFVLQPTLELPGKKPPTQANAPQLEPGVCDIQTLTENLRKANSESAVKAVVDAALAKVSEACGAVVKGVIQSLSEQSVDDGGVFEAGPQETLTLTISRPGATWTYILEGKTQGEWHTSYGFFFVPNRDKKYFTQETHPTDTTTVFTITKQGDREEFDFVPTILFTFLPYGQLGKSWANGFAAGLGYDLEKPVIVAGYAGTYHENVVVSAGLAFHRQSRLLGRYNEGDIVKEALESSQLVEDTYGLNVYLGLSFRFGEDVHARSRELERETARSKAEAAAAKERETVAEQDAAARKAACVAAADTAETAARLKCVADPPADDAPCFEQAAKAAIEARKKCVVTEQDRSEELEKAKQAQCETAAKSTFTAEVLACEDTARKCGATPACQDTLGLCRAKADARQQSTLLDCMNGK